MNTNFFIPTTEAAFIAALTDRDMNRVADENLMPSALFEKQGGVRRFARLGAAFAKFYFDDRSWLMASARKQVLEELTQRIALLQTRDEVFGLLALPDRFNWKVVNFSVEVDMKCILVGGGHGVWLKPIQRFCDVSHASQGALLHDLAALD